VYSLCKGLAVPGTDARRVEQEHGDQTLLEGDQRPRRRRSKIAPRVVGDATERDVYSCRGGEVLGTA